MYIYFYSGSFSNIMLIRSHSHSILFLKVAPVQGAIGKVEGGRDFMVLSTYYITVIKIWGTYAYW